MSDPRAGERLPYGSWPSPVAAADLATGAALPRDAWAWGGRTWWSQNRPDEGGRIQVLRRDPDGSVTDALPAGWNARTRVHEYGGAAWWVHDDEVYATRWDDQRLYRCPPDAEPVPLTPPPPVPQGWRYADGRISPDGRHVICVRETHGPRTEGGRVEDDVHNEIVAVLTAPDGEPAEPTVLVGGFDFVAAPRISPDGTKLAWIAWQCPNMPWDSTVLWVADLVPVEQGPADAVGAAEVRLVHAAPVCGGPNEALVQPEWGPDGELYVVSDRSNWWNVIRIDGVRRGRLKVRPVHPVEAEVALPAWEFGQSRYVVDDAGTVWFTHGSAEGAHLVRVPARGRPHDELLPYLRLESLRFDPEGPDGPRVVAVAAQAAAEPVVVEFRADGDGLRHTVLREPREPVLPAAGRSTPRRLRVPSTGGRDTYAWFYPPAHAEVSGPDGELPPLVVAVHGGPTSAADPSFRLAVQYWTSRGFAYADVDYGGSTGLGRRYRRLLEGQWGIVDVDDVCAVAEHLAAEGLVDPARTAIRGGSAGGFTVLAALAQRDVFAAGADHFGVADLAALARDTHKFEARYLDRLVGPYPEEAAVYAERSPLSHVDGFDRPLIVFQGDEDAVVPPAQSQVIVDALEAKGVPHAYLLFAGEQHGFRKAENIVRAQEAELYFYGRVFGFRPADAIEPVPIAHEERLPPAP